ncbi:uncharacterized protein LOC105767051 [Gossypium raimondii]|uniref:uncharacterized protein LOC105767051 n=1 Tax=Gossypium raimondii TaxID=29730 RepID=UPI00063AD6A8|nr:uncharacterized protein LOC105767051 [Gossypium raimondii]
MKLISGGLLIEAEFLRLSHYARGTVATEYECCAKITEDVKRSKRQNREKDRGRFRRDSEPSSSSSRPKKKAKFDGPVRAGVTVARLQPCANCGRHHLGECWKKIGACFRCRSKEHQVKDYLQRPTQMQAVGSTHSYIVCTVSGTLGIKCESTVNEMTVLSPLRQSVKVDKFFRDVPLEVQGVIFLADLMELPFDEFDLILGMDWAEKLVRKGCEAFQAYIDVFDSEGPSIEDVRTIKDFSDVFPDELPGLPPNREVEFLIELLPGTALVSIAPYRMALKPLVELKAQIKELLDRGFIRPSVSP